MYLMRLVKLIAVAFLLFLSAVPVSALSETEKSFLSMYFTDEELVIVSSTRSLKSITRVAENIEVVTAGDIALMNAHTLADVLKSVTGVQIDIRGGLNGFAFISIQGSDPRHVAVFMDGVLINDFLNGYADIAMLPVQHIQKIEIIKGPASSVWGSSLGGVVNIVTKSGDNQNRNGGTVYGSLGERSFVNAGAELYGKKDKTAYYLYAGRIQADRIKGLYAKNDVAMNNFYLKLSQEIGKDTKVELTTFYNQGERKWTDPRNGTITNPEIENLFASLSLNTSLGDGVNLSLSARSALRDLLHREYYTDTSNYTLHSRDNSHGLSAKLNWSMKDHTLVLGVDYDNGAGFFADEYVPEGQRDRVTKWAVYVNDTIGIGKLSVTPGLRYDHDRIIGSFISPSIGMTYVIDEKTLLRSFIAKGFSSAPSSWATDTPSYGYVGNSDLKAEEVWSYQLGIETGLLRHVWLKTSVFRHDIKDAIIPEDSTMKNKDKIRRQGIEVELKTIPIYNLSFSAGAAYIDTMDLIRDEPMHDIPKYTFDISLKYDDEKSLKALLTGHYIWFDSTKIGAKYNSFIFDFNLIKRFYKQESREADLFLTGHNLFNGSQHSNRFVNPDRWVEAGIRFKF